MTGRHYPSGLFVARFLGFFVLVVDLLSASNLERLEHAANGVFANFKNRGLCLAALVGIFHRQIVMAFLGEQDGQDAVHP